MSLFASLQSQMPAEAASQLEKIDAFWHRYRHEDKAIATVIHDYTQQSAQSGTSNPTEITTEIEFDAIASGGTLGIFIACALQRKGWRVLVIEQGILRGRVQEWNISRRELNTFIELDLLTEEELETAIATTYNPARVGFAGGQDLWVRDILNIGVDPVYLLEVLKQKFLAAGGTLWEQTKFQSAEIYKNGVIVTVEREQEKKQVSGRLLLDVMGHFSPIVQQARSLQLSSNQKPTSQSLKPDGICMVVGSCAQGIPEKSHGDLIYSFTPIQNHCQYFWEAFPAKDGRTTYMFTYVDAEGDRPSFAQLMEDYLFWLPKYQEVELEKLQFQRILFGFFPSYRQSPVQTPWDRVLQVGDSSGMQSPLSFGGFGAMVRHLPRLTAGLDMALAGDWLRKSDLRSLQPYQPNISVTWLFQKSMSVALGEQLQSSQERDRINYLLNVTFTAMQKLGDRVLYPFLQDVVQFVPLAQTMIAMAIADPVLVLKIVRQVGIGTLFDWLQHYLGLGLYSLLNPLTQKLQPSIAKLLPEQQYKLQRQIDQWYYGSGGDWEL